MPKTTANNRHWRLSMLAFAALAAVAEAPGARAEIAESDPSSFVLRWEASIAASPADVYRAIGRIGAYWSPQHTYSGQAGNLRLTLRAGGCFCEEWTTPNGRASVEHGRVVAAIPYSLIRLYGAFGPLQDMGVNAVLSFELSPDGAGTRLKARYLVRGQPSQALDQLAPVVEQVLGEQIARLEASLHATTPAPPR